MTSYYSILQVAPDPLADERVNLGLVAFAEGAGQLKFSSDPARAAFLVGSGATASDIEQLIEGIRADIEPLLETSDSVQQMRDLSEKWQQSVRLTSPRASTLGLDELLASIAPRALPDAVRAVPARRARDRRAAVALAHRTLAKALSQAPKSLKLSRRVLVPGARQPHKFDLGLANGSVRLGVSGLSFEGPTSPDRERELGALNWLVDDVKAHNAAFPISVVVLTSRRGAVAKDKLDVLRELGAEVVREADVEDWSRRIVQEVG